MIKKLIAPQIARVATSEGLDRLREFPARLKHRVTSALPVVSFFHQLDDPYSYLALEAASELVERYRITLNVHLVEDTGPADRHPANWLNYRLHDARRLARAWRMVDFLNVDAPDPADLRRCLRCFPGVASGQHADLALRMSRALWNGKPHVMQKLWEIHTAASDDEVKRLLKQGDAVRAQLGHYQAGMWNFAGKWYWGLDRLEYLEDDLMRWNLQKSEATVHGEFFTPRLIPSLDVHRIDAFFSFRSPYSYLMLDRLFELSKRNKVELRLRPLLPMVQRGIKLSTAKRNYILSDAARIARKHAIPFGRIRDPLGDGVNKCIALFYFARKHHLGNRLVMGLMRAIWSQGVDVSRDRVLADLCEAAGLNWNEARHHLYDAEAQSNVEVNRQQLEIMGLWGVPTFALTDADNQVLSVFWGQDRIPWLEYGLTQ